MDPFSQHFLSLRYILVVSIITINNCTIESPGIYRLPGCWSIHREGESPQERIWIDCSGDGSKGPARGQKSLKLSNSITWSDQNCLRKGAYFAIIFLLEKCVKFRDTFRNPFFIYFWYNTAYITYYEELLFSLDQTITQLNTTLSQKMRIKSKINCGHCGHLNTVEYALCNHRTAGHLLSNHWTVGRTL